MRPAAEAGVGGVCHVGAGGVHGNPRNWSAGKTIRRSAHRRPASRRVAGPVRDEHLSVVVTDVDAAGVTGRDRNCRDYIRLADIREDR